MNEETHAETEEEKMFFHSAPYSAASAPSLACSLCVSLPEQASCLGTYDESIWNVDE